MTLRLARSPDAPNKTTVHASATLPAPELFVSTAVVPPCIGSTSSVRNHWRSTLYLNAVLLQIRPQLLRVLVMDYVHAQAPRVLQIQRPVIDEHALFRGTLRDFQCHAKNHLFRLARAHIAQTKKHVEVPPQMERLNTVLVEF